MTPDDEPSDSALERALRTSRDLEAPPPHVLQRTYGVWRARTDTAAAGLLRRLVAALSFDSGGASGLAFGMRALGAAPRQMVFTAPGCDVELRVLPGPAGASALHGQVLGPAGGGEVLLQRWVDPDAVDADVALRAPLDELGEFAFDRVPAGRYRVTLQLGDTEVVLQHVDVGVGVGPGPGPGA